MDHVAKVTDQNDGNATALVGQNATKTDLLAELMRDPDMLKQIGSAWILYFRLILIDGGRMTGTYDEIGRDVAMSGKTIRNWVSSLDKAGIVKSHAKGHQVDVRLLGHHLKIAQAPNAISNPVTAEATLAPPLSPREMKVLNIVKAAEEAGSQIELKVTL